MDTAAAVKSDRKLLGKGVALNERIWALNRRMDTCVREAARLLAQAKAEGGPEALLGIADKFNELREKMAGFAREHEALRLGSKPILSRLDRRVRQLGCEPIALQ